MSPSGMSQMHRNLIGRRMQPNSSSATSGFSSMAHTTDDIGKE